MITVGMAVAVPEPYGEQLRAARLSFGDRLAEQVPSHITLVPPTAIEPDRLESSLPLLARAARRVSPFEVQLRGTGTFRPVSEVVFVAVSQGIAQTQILAREVRAAMGDVLAEPAFPFHPHVTIAQDIDADSLDRAYEEFAEFGCAFDVNSFALYTHQNDSGWSRFRDFELGGKRSNVR